MNSIKKIKNIILDLDLTLICSIDINENIIVPTSLEHKEMKNYYNIYSRPHLQDFLDFIFKNFNVSIWTAASKDYAFFIIKNFILKNNPDRKLNWIFFSYHCEESKKNNGFSKKIDYLKNVCKISDLSIEDTLIIDDNLDVYECQKNNCYLIKPFDVMEPKSGDDTELLSLINFLGK